MTEQIVDIRSAVQKIIDEQLKDVEISPKAYNDAYMKGIEKAQWAVRKMVDYGKQRGEDLDLYCEVFDRYPGEVLREIDMTDIIIKLEQLEEKVEEKRKRDEFAFKGTVKAGDIIEDDDGVRAIVLDVDIDSAFWIIDENGCCGVEDNEGRTWRRVGHTNMVGTLLNVLKEG